MTTTLRPSRYRTQTSLTIGFLGSLLLTSCAAAPFLIPVAFEFAKNLFQTGLSNYGSKHRDNLSNLVNRLSSPYMQGLPQAAMAGPGVPGQPGVLGQPGMPPQAFPGQQQFPAQQGVPGQQTYPGQQIAPGQPGAYDPNNPYGSAGAAYPGASTYPGTTPSPYGTAQGYPAQPGMTPYDPNNPYGAAATEHHLHMDSRRIPTGNRPIPMEHHLHMDSRRLLTGHQRRMASSPTPMEPPAAIRTGLHNTERRISQA
jgi:hypothetical protein